MKRTKALMATVTTSLMLTGAHAAAEPLAQAPGQIAPTDPDPWKKDPQIGKAADQVLAWLKDTKIESAKTTEEIQRHFSGMAPATVGDALKRLFYENRIKRTGDGSKATPYKFYERESGVD